MQLHEDYYAKSAFLGEIDDALAARIPDVHRVLTTDKTIYWAQQRSLKCISNQIKRAWRTVYVFHKQSDELVGFCRVVGDGEGFAYLCDVFVTAQHNKKGIASYLVDDAVKNSASSESELPSTSWRWFLWTKDAHTLYAKAGFKPPSDGWAMELVPEGPPLS